MFRKSLMIATSVLIALAPAFTAAAETTSVVTYHREFVGNYDQFMAALRNSLRLDPTGHARLNEKVCEETGDDCVTPVEIQQGLYEQHHGDLHVAKNFESVRLIAFCAATYSGGIVYEGLYESSREAKQGNKTWIETHGLKRRAHNGESVYFAGKDWNGNVLPANPAIAIFFGDCWNVLKAFEVEPIVASATPTKCETLHPFAHAHGKLFIALQVTPGEKVDLSNKCFQHFQLCDHECKFNGAESAATKYEGTTYVIAKTADGKSVIGEISDTVEGDNPIQLPPATVASVCLEEADGTTYLVQTTFTAIYRNGDAWIKHDTSERPDKTYAVYWKPKAKS
jgi:hypothetical protein